MNRHDDVTEERVRNRAFELWQKHGGEEGYESEFWLQAERELTGERAATTDSPNADCAMSGAGSDGPR